MIDDPGGGGLPFVRQAYSIILRLNLVKNPGAFEGVGFVVSTISSVPAELGVKYFLMSRTVPAVPKAQSMTWEQ